jgi:hypothetical protein
MHKKNIGESVLENILKLSALLSSVTIFAMVLFLLLASQYFQLLTHLILYWEVTGHQLMTLTGYFQ